MTKKQIASSLNSTKALDEVFAYAYKLRKVGLDATIVKNVIDSVLIGAPAVLFECNSEELTDEQKKLVSILENNGFEVKHYGKNLVVKNIHFDKIKDEIDKYLENK